jgi:DNA gyrase subunit B
LADGRALSFKEIVAEQALGKEHYCYTIRKDGQIGIERVINARVTKRNTEVIRVNLDNRETITCTPDHRFMLRDGSYKPAAELSPDDSLMPLYRKLSDISEPGITINGYEMVWDPRSGYWLFTHLVSDWFNRWHGFYSESDGDHCHHRDFNKLNNNPTNLQRLPADVHLVLHREHIAKTLHRPEIIDKCRKKRQTPEFRAKMSERMQQPETREVLSMQAKVQWKDETYKTYMNQKWQDFYATNEDYRQQNNTRLYQAQHKYWSDESNREAQSERVRTFFTNNPETRKEYSLRAQTQWQDESLRTWRSEKTQQQWTADFRAKRKEALHQTYYNKTIAALMQFKTENGNLDLNAYDAHRCATRDKSLLRFDTFCQRYFQGDRSRAFDAVANYNHRIVSIERTEERIDVYDIEVPHTHNFALASGIFVHNSAKQGRDRRFQAILPLKGKILNVEKARYDKMLAHGEISAMIVALGTGIGKEDFDVTRLRYHRIVIMTDADVDGSHIRTLLLTFFYRQMPELIERGHIYIAQPPLFKVKKGRSEQYITNEKELNRYLMKRATEDVIVTVKQTGRQFEGRELIRVLEKQAEFSTYYYKLEKRFHDRRLLDTVLDALAGEQGLMRSGAKLHQIFEDVQLLGKIRERLQEANYKFELEQDEEHGLYELKLTRSSTQYGSNTILIDWELATHVEFQKAVLIYMEQTEIMTAPFEIVQNGSTSLVNSRDELLSQILNAAKKDVQIQRYKGLGEMNPDQLWETTMNPTKRTLLQVRVDDAVETDEIFTVLMGDAVEPRRKFIEDFALDVRNLDI